MAQKSIEKVTQEDDYMHVRFRPPSQFETIRTPGYASDAAQDTSKGAKVRMGRTEAGNWLVQSVLLRPRGIRGKRHARSLARRIQQSLDA